MSAPAQPRAERTCPVYAELQAHLAHERLDTANTGLIFDRYADIWSGRGGNWKPAPPDRGPSVRFQFLQDVRNGLRTRAPAIGALLASFHMRRAALWQRLGAQVIDLASTAPLVSGFGMTHVLDAGFVWDWNLGLPYLPASSLKGAARAWALQWDGMAEGDAIRIFGQADHTEAGAVVFHALYPVHVPELRLDVLNPHYGAYYRKERPGNEGPAAPGDWLAPEPVFFLTVAPSARFCTAVHGRVSAREGDLAVATACLRQAVSTLGIGAKTALGYGMLAEAEVDEESAPGRTQVPPSPLPTPSSPPARKPAGATPGDPPHPLRDVPQRGGQERRPVIDGTPGSSPLTAEDLQRRFQRSETSPGATPKRESAGDKAKRQQRELMDRLRRNNQRDP